MREPLISVIVPCYNVEKYVGQCIQSIINQTYNHLEIILINDGSTDATGDICDKYAVVDKRIVVIHQKNTGIAAARKPGIESAKGEYLGFVDGDDWIEPTMYAHLLEKMLLHDVDFVAGGWVTEYANYSVETKIEEPINYRKVYEEDRLFFFKILEEGKMHTVMWNKLFKKNIPEQYYLHIPNNIKVLTDVFSSFSYLPELKAVFITDEVLYHYNKVNETSITNNLNINFVQDVVKFYKFEEELYYKYSNCNELIQVLNKYFLRFLFMFLPSTIGESVNRYLVPAERLMEQKKVLLYGAGKVGADYYYQIKEMKNLRIIGILDKEKSGKFIDGLEILNPKCIRELNFDIVIIGVYKKEIVEEITEELVNKYYIDRSVIVWEKPKRVIDLVTNT